MNNIDFFTPVLPHDAYTKQYPKKSALIRLAENYFSFSGVEAHCIDSGENRIHRAKIVKRANSECRNTAQNALKISSYFTVICPLVALTIKSAHRWNNTFCLSDSPPEKVPYSLFSDCVGNPRYNDIQMKAAHNSFDKGSLTSQLTFSQSEPWEGGCLAIEFDLVQNPEKSSPEDDWEFVLQHGKNYSSSSRSLTDALREVYEWSERMGDHPVVTIHFDLKETCFYGDNELFAQKFDSVIEKVVPRDKIITPAQIQKDKGSLQEAINSYGWPELNEIKGKFILVFTGDDRDKKVSKRRSAYVKSAVKDDHLAFVDMDQRVISSLEKTMKSDQNRIFLNVKLGSNKWDELVSKAHNKKLVTRIWKANSEKAWNQCLDSVNIIATDKIFGSPWAAL